MRHQCITTPPSTLNVCPVMYAAPSDAVHIAAPDAEGASAGRCMQLALARAGEVLQLQGGSRILPRFQGEHLEKNLGLVRTVDALASAKGCTAAQVALAWVLAQGEDIVPIPGTKRRTYLESNAAAVQIGLTGEELSALAAAFPIGAASGARYPSDMGKMVDPSKPGRN